jgi:peptidoglycan/LPS O-acetylase OafA/YrhL
LGIVIFRIYEKPEFQRFLRKKSVAPLLDVAACVALLYGLVRVHYVATVCLAVLFVAAMHDRTIIGRIMRDPLLMMFGKCCYSIYLLHFGVLLGLTGLNRWLFLKLGLENSTVEVRFVIWFIIVGAICLVFGLIMFRYLEKPFVRMGKAVVNRINGVNAKITTPAPEEPSAA